MLPSLFKLNVHLKTIEHLPKQTHTHTPSHSRKQAYSYTNEENIVTTCTQTLSSSIHSALLLLLHIKAPSLTHTHSLLSLSLPLIHSSTFALSFYVMHKHGLPNYFSIPSLDFSLSVPCALNTFSLSRAERFTFCACALNNGLESGCFALVGS